MTPPRRKITLHSIPVTAAGKRKQISNEIEKQKRHAFLDEWKTLRLFLEH